MRPGGAVLAALRATPALAVATWGFVTRGGPLANAIGGACTLACAQFGASSIYQITVAAGAGDFYIPYGNGAARHCDVPQGQPNGTLVVTAPMNGCALEVRDIGGGINRFYHDADGNNMPNPAPGNQQFRVTAAAYEGPAQTVHNRALRYFDAEVQMALVDAGKLPNVGGYEYDMFCVKNGNNWDVYTCASILLNGDAWQVKDIHAAHLGQFAD